MIQEMIDSNDSRLHPCLISGKWCEIDTKQDLENADKEYFFLDHVLLIHEF